MLRGVVQQELLALPRISPRQREARDEDLRTRVQSLKLHREQQQREQEAPGTARQHSGQVFTTAQGGAIDPTNLTRTFNMLLRTAGLSEVMVEMRGRVRGAPRRAAVLHRAGVTARGRGGALPRVSCRGSDSRFLSSARRQLYAHGIDNLAFGTAVLSLRLALAHLDAAQRAE
ncbi:hypothetical protein ABZY14_05845 [Streptomyces sp. NPDC006617]|uniref:hypothetical protein n=1 Tax=Streptomyces sp. NPDC006617 TaxID=3155354 RepID=UPI0033B6A1C4